MADRSAGSHYMFLIGRYLLVVAVLFGLGACSSISYYSQSVIGHTRLMLAREPLERVIPEAGPELAQQLRLAQALRRYASNALGLPDNDSYSDWVSLEREFPVWTVVAARPLSLQAKSWCYLIIGCAGYRGYFDQQDALDYAIGLQQRGWETSVGGATAYSTLGWFDDPLLPSMLRYGDDQLAETLFHELAHQAVWLNGASGFNEAFATTVAEQGVLRWLREQRPTQLARYQHKLQARDDFDQLIDRIKRQLQQLYDSELDTTAMLEGKAALFAELQDRYAVLKQQSWQDVGWFDGWFEQPLNNARLAAFSTYRTRVPDFVALLANCDRDFRRFYQVVQSVAPQGEDTQVPTKCTDAD